MKTVLVVDDDLGFLFWLANTLESCGYNVVPAVSIPKARSILRVLALVPDLLIISPVLSDTAEFIRSLKRDSPGLRVVAAVDGDMQEAGRIFGDVDRWGRKPPGLIMAEGAILDPMGEKRMGDSLKVPRAEWLLIVRTALEGSATSAD